MNVATIYTSTRDATHTDASQFPDATLLGYLNKIYRRIINLIRSKVKEWFFYQEWTTDTVIWQAEFTMQGRTASVAWMVKIDWISRKAKWTDTEFKKLRCETISNLSRDLHWYEDNQPAEDPFYIINDNSYFIYPVPTEVIVWWQIVYGISDPIDLATWWAESTIKIPLEYHELLPLWMEHLVYKAQGKTNEKNDSLAEFNQWLAEMITVLTDRNETPLISEMPDELVYFK